MERRIPVMPWPAKFLTLALLLASLPALANERLVLIASVDSEVEQLDSLEVRKLFLGMTVTRSSGRLRPLLNDSDVQMRNVFLQNVVSMTDTVYDRRILRLAMAGEANLPPRYADKEVLLSAVAANKLAISFAWARDVEHDRRFKILRTLWHD
jgi:hypothetical protein